MNPKNDAHNNKALAPEENHDYCKRGQHNLRQQGKCERF
jgi:hypothetical protein